LRKRKKSPNQTIPQFVVPEVVDQIVNLEEYLQGQEQIFQPNNPNSALIAPQYIDVEVEFIDNAANETQAHQNDENQESLIILARQDAVFEFQGDDVVSEPTKKQARVVNQSPFYDAVNTASQGKINLSILILFFYVILKI